MSNFVTLTREQFEAALPSPWREVHGEKAWEAIYEVDTPQTHLAIRLYSTVDKRNNVTRAKGADAIRIVYWDSLNDRPIGKGIKILRVEGRTTIADRIRSRIDTLINDSHRVPIVDYNYVRAVLEHEAVGWMDFAQNLLEGLVKYGSLTDGQLAYVLGETNPRGKLTFEARVLSQDSGFKNSFMANNITTDESEGEHESYAGNTENEDDLDVPFETSTTEPEGCAGEENDSLPVSAPREADSQLPDGLAPTSAYPYWQYPFPAFNPVQSMVLPFADSDTNVIIGANTSAGKTICSELLMDPVLHRAERNRVIYLSPLKSLTQEKYEDWQKRFPDFPITILTGDYTLNEDTKKELSAARIIVMTSEMCDSRTRRMHTERNYWLKEVGLVIVDESHIISTERGHAVETGLMRFVKINPHARILFLSATMPNCDELGSWLTVLNEKSTDVLFNTWRPVQLNFKHHEYVVERYSNGRENYYGNQKRKLNLAAQIVQSKPDEKFLVFVHDKNTGRQLVKQLEEEGVRALFHNADLDMSERLETENSFRQRDGGLQVLISTSTLAWGSVAEGTLITLANGIKIPVEKLVNNDRHSVDILSYNESTGLLEPDSIISINKYKPCMEVRITLEDGTVLTVDRKHPFYVRTLGGVVIKEADQLNENDDVILENEFHPKPKGDPL